MFLYFWLLIYFYKKIIVFWHVFTHLKQLLIFTLDIFLNFTFIKVKKNQKFKISSDIFPSSQNELLFHILQKK